MPCAKFQKEKPTLLKLSFPIEKQIWLCRQNKMKWKTAGNVSRKGTYEKEYKGKTLKVRTRNLIKLMAKGQRGKFYEDVYG